MNGSQSIRGAALVMGCAIASFAALAGHASATPPVAPLQGSGDSACLATNSVEASPDVVLLGETVDVTMTLSAVCSGDSAPPVNIVLVMDGSGSMAGAPNREMKKAARTLVQALNLEDNPATRIGVVQFNSATRVLCELTNRTGHVNSCIGRVGAFGGSNISAGINTGLRVLLRGRVDGGAADSLREVMVVLADGQDNRGCGDVLQAANTVKGMGILLVTICVGTSCDAQCMRQVATSPRYFFEARSATTLSQVFEQIRRILSTMGVRELQVVENVPSNMALIGDRIAPRPVTIGPLDAFVEWRFRFIPASGVTMTYSVRPLEVGYWPTSAGASGVYTDSLGKTGRVDYPAPHVLVMDPRSLETATPTTPPPPTTTPSASPTTRPIEHRIYLPVAFAGP